VVLNGRAGVCSMPVTPSTIPASAAGTDSAQSLSRSFAPFTWWQESEVENACSTCAAVPDAFTAIRSADTWPTLNPLLRRKVVTLAT